MRDIAMAAVGGGVEAQPVRTIAAIETSAKGLIMVASGDYPMEPSCYGSAPKQSKVR
jgi:hypothetical protein